MTRVPSVLRRTTAVLMAGALCVIATPAAWAAETLSLVTTTVDGTAGFDASPGPGKDTGDSNGVVRTNDLITYNAEVRVAGGAASNVTIKAALPRGVEMRSLPGFCVSGSTINTQLPAPNNATLTATTYQSLPAQTVTCVVGDRTDNSTKTYGFPATVRPEVPNGVQLGTAAITVTSTGDPTGVTNSVDSPVVSAAAKYDLSKNASSPTENTGYYYQDLRPCTSAGHSGQCYYFQVPVLLSAPQNAKGTTPLVGDITFTDDLSNASFFPGVSGIPASAGAALLSCIAGNGYQTPYSRIGSQAGATATNSVRDTGTYACSQPGGAGTPVNMRLTGTDTTVYTAPAQAGTPSSYTLMADQAYVASFRIQYEVPVSTVQNYGNQTGSTWTLPWKNTLTNLSGTDMNGDPVQPESNLTNNYRSETMRLEPNGAWEKFFAGFPNDPSNTPATQFYPAWNVVEGPTQASARRAGDGVVAPNQRVISMLNVGNRSAAGTPDQQNLLCDGWDKSRTSLGGGAVPGATFGGGANMQAIGTAANTPVWLSGYYREYQWAKTTPAGLNLTVQYAAQDGANGMACDDPSITWYNTPDAVPGNDPTELANNVYTGVGRVRVFLTLPEGTGSNAVQANISIALLVRNNADGTLVPNRAAGRQYYADGQTLADAVANPSTMARPSYDPATNTGNLGDRLKVANAVARLGKQVQQNDGSYGTGVPNYTVGSTVGYRLQPTISSAVDSGMKTDVTVEDCLHADTDYLDATPAPVLVQDTTPADAGLTCAAGQTYLRWLLPAQTVNRPVTRIDYTVKVRKVASSGTKQNTALVSIAGDPSTAAVRTATATINLAAPAGVQIDKAALTPVVEVNRVGEADPDPLQWRIDFANVGTSGVSDVDIIDRLPRSGDADGSSFSGSLAFRSITEVTGGPLTFEYTNATAVRLDPKDASNAAAGATTWCDAPAGGAVRSGTGTCPTAADQVTGVRIKRAGAFAAGGRITARIDLLPSGNAAGDQYVNTTMGRATGVALPVGPVKAPETVIGSAVGDRVWADLNHNGIQDSGEPGVPNIPVTVSGTDTDGNAVTATTTTAADGSYLVNNLQSGNYQVQFDQAAVSKVGAFTSRSAGSDTSKDSDPDPATGTTPTFTLAAQTTDRGWDAGIIGTASLGDLVWKDLNRNGIQDAGEPGLPNVTVTVTGTDANGLPVNRTATTDADGIWSMDQLYASDSAGYTVTVVAPADYVASPAEQGADRTKDSGGTTFTVAFAGGSDQSLDVGLYPSPAGSIGNLVWEDLNHNGIQDPGEPGLDGVSVRVTGTDNRGVAVDQTVVTDNGGNWTVADLHPGDYTVAVTLFPGYRSAPTAVGSDPEQDSNGIGFPVRFDGTRDLSLDTGVIPPADGSLGDTVWRDNNLDGIQDTGEPGVSGVTVRVTGTNVDGAQVDRTVTTDADGHWVVDNLYPGDYHVAVQLPIDAIATKVGAGADPTKDSNGASFDVTLGIGNDLTLDTGIYLTTPLSGTVWTDTNSNGTMDPGESPLESIVVRVRGIDMTGAPVDVSTITDAVGHWVVRHLLPGDYAVEIQAPKGYTGATRSQVSLSNAPATVNLPLARPSTGTTASPSSSPAPSTPSASPSVPGPDTISVGSASGNGYSNGSNSPGSLARTGADVAGILAAAALLIGGGALLVRRTRRG